VKESNFAFTGSPLRTVDDASLERTVVDLKTPEIVPEGIDPVLELIHRHRAAWAVAAKMMALRIVGLSFW
jgi:hypothetical protein